MCRYKCVMLVGVLCFFLFLLAACGHSDADLAHDNSSIASDLSWDNPSYYLRDLSTHPLAETEAGYYVFLNNLLHYVDKVSLEAVLLSGQPYSPEELLSSRDKLAQSDAYFGDSASVFYRGDSLLILSPKYRKEESCQLFELALEGGERKELASLNISAHVCLLGDTLYAIKNTITEQSDRLSTLVSYDLASKSYKEYPPFPDEMRGGLNLHNQRLLPYKGKVYMETIVAWEDREDSVVYCLDPSSEAASLFVGRFQDQDQKEERVLQSLTFYEDKVLINTSKEEAQSLKADNQVLQWEGEEISPFKLIDWPMVLLSNGHDLLQVPSEVTWISHVFPLGEDYAENAKASLRIEKLGGDQSLTLNPKLLTPKVFPIVMVNEAGEVLIYNSPGNSSDSAYLLIPQEGDFKRIP
ncbi:MAG: hypothetical protein SPK23_06520 [Eubacteriales bacterium]|nr:hypothetical protein [Eubacteriales bacterium]